MRRFLSRFVLATLGSWLAATLIPGITTDGVLSTFLLMGMFIAVGDMIITILDHGAGILLFFLPKSFRLFVLRTGIVGISTALVSGFAFTAPVAVGLIGTTLILSLLFLLPFAT